MKKLIRSLLLCFALSSTFDALAQESLKPTISMQPLWGPTGYNVAAYYYLPDIEVYYDVPEKKFIYQDKGKWAHSASLPEKFQNYDLFSGYKVVLNRPHPYFNLNAHRARYGRFKGQLNKQETIKQSSNRKYFVVEGHPKANELSATSIKANTKALSGN